MGTEDELILCHQTLLHSLIMVTTRRARHLLLENTGHRQHLPLRYLWICIHLLHIYYVVWIKKSMLPRHSCEDFVSKLHYDTAISTNFTRSSAVDINSAGNGKPETFVRWICLSITCLWIPVNLLHILCGGRN